MRAQADPNTPLIKKKSVYSKDAMLINPLHFKWLEYANWIKKKKKGKFIMWSIEVIIKVCFLHAFCPEIINGYLEL
jgi:hypothetical protein